MGTSPLVREAAKTELAQAITAGGERLSAFLCVHQKESYLQGGLLVQEIQSVLEALVVPGMQNKPENVVKEPATLHYETPALREHKGMERQLLPPQRNAPKCETQLCGAVSQKKGVER